MTLLRLLAAFIRRDWSYETSYRGMMILQILGGIGSLIIFYSIGRLVGSGAESLEPYGGEYFPFALIGLTVSDYFTVGLRAFANRLRLAQTTGTLEAMFVTQTPGHWILLYSGVWDFLIVTARLAMAILLGILIFGVDFQVNILAALPLAVLSLISFAAIGVIAAAAILVIKRGDAVAALGSVFATVFAGTLFPIVLLPDWLRPLAYILPLHYALDGLRQAVLIDAGLADVGDNLLILTFAVAILAPLAYFSVGWATRWVRRDGSLGHY